MRYLSEEQKDASLLALRLLSSARVRERNADYNRRLTDARRVADGLSPAEIIEQLIAHNPAYIRTLLETEDARFGTGSLRERYARTFANQQLSKGATNADME
jgi:hypothetical protein